MAFICQCLSINSIFVTVDQHAFIVNKWFQTPCYHRDQNRMQAQSRDLHLLSGCSANRSLITLISRSRTFLVLSLIRQLEQWQCAGRMELTVTNKPSMIYPNTLVVRIGIHRVRNEFEFLRSFTIHSRRGWPISTHHSLLILIHRGCRWTIRIIGSSISGAMHWSWRN